jgi:hypothetical protein
MLTSNKNKNHNVKKLPVYMIVLLIIISTSLSYYDNKGNSFGNVIAIKSIDEMILNNDSGHLIKPEDQFAKNDDCIITRVDNEYEDSTHLIQCHSGNDLYVMEALL